MPGPSWRRSSRRSGVPAVPRAWSSAALILCARRPRPGPDAALLAGRGLRVYDHDVEPDRARRSRRSSTTVRRPASTCRARRSGRSSARSASALLMLGLVFGGWLLAGRGRRPDRDPGRLAGRCVAGVPTDGRGGPDRPPRHRSRAADPVAACSASWPCCSSARVLLQTGLLPPRLGHGGAGCAGAVRIAGRRHPGRRAVRPRPPASGGAPPSTGSGPADVTITAQGIAFVETTVTGPAGQAVHARLRQRGPRRSPTTSSSRTRPGRGLQGRDLHGRRDAGLRRPGPAGRRVHVRLHGPPEHDGHRDAPVGRRASCRDDRSCSPSPSRRSSTVGVVAARRRPRGRRPAGRSRRSRRRPIVGTTLDGAPFDLAAPPRAARSSSTSGGRRASPAATSSRCSRRSSSEHAADGLAIVGVLTDDPAEPARDFVAEYGGDVADGRRPGQGDQDRLPGRRPAADLLRRRAGRDPVDPDRRAHRRRLRAPVRPDRAVTGRPASRRSLVDGLVKRYGTADRRRRRVADGRAAARSSRCSDPTAPARRRRSRSSRATGAADGGHGPGPGRRPGDAAGATLRARVGLMLQGGGIDLRARPRETLAPVRAASTPIRATRTSCSTWSACGRSRGPRYRRLSGGERQRLGLALALVGRPEVVDPRRADGGDGPGGPGRDPGDRRGPARRRASPILLTSHDLADVERLADRIDVLVGGPDRRRPARPRELTAGVRPSAAVPPGSAARRRRGGGARRLAASAGRGRRDGRWRALSRSTASRRAPTPSRPSRPGAPPADRLIVERPDGRRDRWRRPTSSWSGESGDERAGEPPARRRPSPRPRWSCA